MYGLNQKDFKYILALDCAEDKRLQPVCRMSSALNTHYTTSGESHA